MMARKLTRAGWGALITMAIAIGFGREAVARETAWPLPNHHPQSKPAVRLAFNASSHRLAADSFLPANQPAPEESGAVDGLRKAAAAGDARAQLSLGLCYEGGRGVSRDTGQAIHWIRKAAEQGFDEAQYALGCCYNGDDGFPKDSGEAVKWWQLAAAQDYADAQYCLGLSYYTGEGVAKNPAAAAKWWKKAAVQNHADAQYFLGLSYSIGLGVPKTEEQAIYWLSKAAALGNENAMAALKKLGKAFEPPADKQSVDRLRHRGADRTG